MPTPSNPRRNPDNAIEGQIGGGPGASDGSNGGGAGAGIPGGGTDIRTGGQFTAGNVDDDRRKLFPEARIRPDTPVDPPMGEDDPEEGNER